MATADTTPDEEELCPYCGKWAVLNTYTGFCEKCSEGISYSATQSLTHNNKLEKFLQDNADHLEHYISQGHSLSTAISRVYDANRPRCSCCGVLIKRAAKTAIFCRDNPRCRRASRRYVYLYRERGLTKADALAKVLSELTGE